MCKNSLQSTAFYLSILLTCCITLVMNEANAPLNLIYRETWLPRRNEASIYKKLQRPIRYIVFDDFTDGGKFSCSNLQQCINLLQTINSEHKTRWSDIGYNFLMDGNGTVYEGRGWFKQGFVVQGFNHMCLSVGYIGNYLESLTSPPAKEIIHALDQLTTLGTTLYLLHPSFRVITRRQIVYRRPKEMNVTMLYPQSLSNTKFYSLISNYSHWFNGVITLSVLHINALLTIDDLFR